MNGHASSQLIGNLGRDPELRYTTSGTAVTNMRVAVNTYRGKDKGEQTDWFTVVAWGGLAETCAEHLSKGDAIFVEAKPRQNAYETRDGDTRRAVEFVAKNITFLPRNGRGGRRSEQASAQQPPYEDVPF